LLYCCPNDYVNGGSPWQDGGFLPTYLLACSLNHPIAHTIRRFVFPYLILDQKSASYSRLFTPHYSVACAEIIPSSINSSNVYSITRSFSGSLICTSFSSMFRPTTFPLSEERRVGKECRSRVAPEH